MTTAIKDRESAQTSHITIPETNVTARRVIGIGAGGHARVVADILRTYTDVELVGFVDSNTALHGSSVDGLPVLGDDCRLATLINEGVTHAFVGLGATRTLSLRHALFDKATRAGFKMITAIHPRSHVSHGAQLGTGVAIMAGAMVNTGAVIGDNAIVNTGAIIEHDCRIGRNTHVATGAVLTGGITVGEDSLVGAGSTIRQCLTIGDRCIVGAGSVVINNLRDDSVVAGVPAVRLKRNGYDDL